MVKYLDKKFIKSLIPLRDENSNKGDFGKILNVAGSANFPGAAVLSSISALKAGAGLVTLACPDVIINRIATCSPEITFMPLNSTVSGSISDSNELSNISEYSVISAGCGITTDEQTQKFLINLLKQIKSCQKLVIDADGINNLAKYKGEITLKNAVITPHPKELSRLLHVNVEEIIDNREKYARITSQTFECITVLKGHNTIITDGENIYINTTGNSALAKAGTGDVLTGIISGFLAQKLSPINAALLGVFLQGLSGDFASDDLTQFSVLASDVIDYLPFAFDDIIYNE